jgi:hypothetical protein
MNFRPLGESVQEPETRRELLESDIKRETHRGWSALSGRILMSEEGADAVLVTHNVFSEFIQGHPSRFTRPGNSAEHVTLALMREKLPQVGHGTVEIPPKIRRNASARKSERPEW